MSIDDPADLPDLAIDKILQFLPAKTTVQVSLLSKQHQRILSSAAALNFDEDDDAGHHDRDLYYYYLLQHYKYINFLNGFINHREKYEQTAGLDKLRLHLTSYVSEDDTTINRWLEFANDRGVKELDLSPKMNEPEEFGVETDYNYEDYYFYDLPWMTFVNAKSLTTLKLEEVAVYQIKRTDHQREERLLPSLKYMSFTQVWIQDKALHSILLECPSVEYMSMSDCTFEKWSCHISSSSLKSLILSDSYKLKSLNISVDNLERLAIQGSHQEVDATIDIRNGNALKFIGYSEAKFNLKENEAILIMLDVTEENCILPSSTYFTSLWNFLKRFDYCKDITLYIQDFGAFIFPRRFIKNFPPLFPKCSLLQVSIKTPPEEESRDQLNLMSSLRCLAPSAGIIIKKADGRFQKEDEIGMTNE